MRFQDKADQQAFADSNITRLAAFAQTPATYTALGFSPRGSNVSQGDISDAFTALGVSKSWEKMSAISSQLGASRVSLAGDYTNLAKARHRSAHDPTGNVPSSDLATHIDTAILIGIVTDVLATAASEAYTVAARPSDLEHRLSAISPSYRFIDLQDDGTALEFRAGAVRAAKRYQNEAAAIAGAASRKSADMVIVRNNLRLPIMLA